MRSPRLVVLALAAAALISGSSAPALAEPTQKQWAEWKQLVESSKKAMREGRPGDAAEALRRAHGIHQSPTVEVDLAAALTASGKLVEARKLFAKLAASTEPGVIWKRARDAAKKALADLDPRVPKLRVTIKGSAGAAVTVDGANIPTDADVPLDPGDHRVVATADGFVTVERSVSLAAGKQEQVTLEMAATPAPAAPPEDSRGSRVPGIVLLGVGGAGLIVGGVFGGLAFSAASTAKAQCKGNLCPAAAQSDIDRSRLHGNVSTGLFIGGGVVAAVGIVLTIVAPGGKKAEPQKDSVALTPLLSPDMMGLAGKF